MSRARPRIAMSHVLAAVFLAGALSAGGPHAALAATFALRGHVQKGAEHQPLPGISVSLHVVQGSEELPGKTAISSADGSFEFPNLTLDPQHSYFLSAEYAGAYYTEGPVQPSGPEAVQDLVVYDVGRDLGSVRVTNHHIIVERGTNDLHVTEIVVFQNSGTTAYLGTGLNHAENVGVRLGLPASIKEFQAGMGGDDQTVRVQGRDMASLRPIPPGTRPFSFSYHVPLSGRMDLSHRLYFPTDRFVVLIEDPKLKLDSKSLDFAGERDQGGRKFQIYQASNFPVGAEVRMRIQGAGFWSNPGIYPWLIAPFLIIAALIFAAKRGRRAVTPIPVPIPIPSGPLAPDHATGTDDEFATIYLYLIDALDRGVERGEVSKDAHALVRRNLKRRLESILGAEPRTGTR